MKFENESDIKAVIAFAASHPSIKLALQYGSSSVFLSSS